MPRTTNAARALGALTIWAAAGLAVTGCVNVTPHRAPDPAPPARTGPPPAAVRPQIVRQPAVESLDRLPGATRSPGARPAPPAAAKPPAPRVPRHRDPVTDPPRRRPAPPPRRPAPRVAPGGIPDVCGLAEAHGGWHRNSPQARACRDAARF
ncbi:hypothetical protein [Streptomyces sp. NPDC058953]|uniref:hypothetical protein n=1 Tax=unclassified Streptomyces TaxID=2593676 RepID=UPI0036B6D3CA